MADRGAPEDGGAEDSGGAADGSTEDTRVDPDLPCTSETFAFVSDPITRDREVSSAATERGFLFGWGDAVEVREQVRFAELANGAVMPMLNRLTDDDHSARQVQIADGFAAWVDDGGDGLAQIVRGIELGPTRAQQRDLSATTGTHVSPRLAETASGWAATWLRQGTNGFTIELRTFSAEETGSIVELPWSVPSDHLAFDVLDERAYFAWVDEGVAQLAVASLDGQTTSTPVAISSSAVVQPAELSIAFDRGFGVVAYGVLVDRVRYEVRARIVDADGVPTRAARVVSEAPLRGRRPSAAAYAGGYAVAYRAMLPDESTELRLAFVHGSEGRVVAEYSLGEATFDGARSGVSVAADGALGVGWANAENNGAPVTQIRGARLECEAAWLRCGVMP